MSEKHPLRSQAAAWYNATWDLMEKTDRSPLETLDMLALAQASFRAWLEVPDHTTTHESIGAWQVSRAHALAGEARLAEAWAHRSLSAAAHPAVDGFYRAYAREALARAFRLQGRVGDAVTQLSLARKDLATSAEDETESLLADLVALEIPPQTTLSLVRFDAITEPAWLDYVAEWLPTGEHFVPLASDPRGRTFGELQLAWADAETDKARERGYVPATLYFLVDSAGRLLGSASFRRELTDRLRLNGGNIGYGIRPSARHQGHGRRQLELVLQVARERGLERALITCDDSNEASVRTIEAVGGVLQDKPIFEGVLTMRYWVDLASEATS
jgi:predicted acetyltransferase